MTIIGGQWKTAPGGKLSRHLFPLLKALDPDVQCERTFDWLFLPRAAERTSLESRLASALVDHCRASRSRHPRKEQCDPDALFAEGRITGRSRRLEFDFYLPRFKVALEFDERQHFTDERRCTLELYDFIPDGFDLKRWIELCSPRIIDAFPPCRDWERAYRDAVRDLRARINGMPLVRLYYRDFSRPSIADSEIRSSLEQSIVYARRVVLEASNRKVHAGGRGHSHG